MNVFGIASLVVLVFVIMYIGKNTSIPTPLLNENNVMVVLAIAVAVLVFSMMFDKYNRDIEMVCMNIPRKCEFPESKKD